MFLPGLKPPTAGCHLPTRAAKASLTPANDHFRDGHAAGFREPLKRSRSARTEFALQSLKALDRVRRAAGGSRVPGVKRGGVRALPRPWTLRLFWLELPGGVIIADLGTWVFRDAP